MDDNRIVYLDVLFATELLMNVLVLFLYCGLSKKKFRRKTCLLAVLISSICGVMGIILAGSRSWWNSGCSLVLSCGIAFLELAILEYTPGRKIKQIFLELPALLLSAFLLAGGLILFFPMDNMKSRVGQPVSLAENAPAWNLKALVVSAVLCTAFTAAGLAILRIRNKGQHPENLKTVWITLEGRTYTVIAITDTGNNLYDKLSGMPVHIVEEDRILTEKQKEQLLEKKPERITFVPYSSLGTSNGLLMVLLAEQLMILDNGKKIKLKNQKLGLTKQKLCSSGEWQMLLHPDLEACGIEQNLSPASHKKGGCI